MEMIPERLTIRIDQVMQCELTEVARKEFFFHLSQFVRAAIREKITAWRAKQAEIDARNQANLDRLKGKTSDKTPGTSATAIAAKPRTSKKRSNHVD